LLSAKPKTGKTTLLFHLLRTLFEGKPFLGSPTHRPGPVLLLTEESSSLLRQRLARLGLGHEDLWVLRRTVLGGWPEALALIRAAINQDVRLVIIDTLATFWGIQEENDASTIHNTLLPLQRLAQEHGVAVLLIHHLRKTDGEEGTAHRGSGAIVAVADIAVEMRRVAHQPCRRLLQALSRLEETPIEGLIELQHNEYVYLGPPTEVSHQEAKSQLGAALPGPDEPPLTREQLRERLDPKPSDTLMKRVLLELEQNGVLEKRGSGRRGDPFCYRRRGDADTNSTRPGHSPSSNGAA